MSIQHTSEQWQTFTAKITRAAERSGMTRADAEDIAQDIAARYLAGRFAKGAADLDAVVRIARSIARRAGTWAALGDQTHRDYTRYLREKRKPAFALPVRDASTAYPSPVAMAEAADRQGFPVERIHAVYGIGPTALHEAGTTPDVIGSGPGWTMPEPIPADRYPTDPNPVGRIMARIRCANDWRRVAGLPPIQ